MSPNPPAVRARRRSFTLPTRQPHVEIRERKGGGWTVALRRKGTGALLWERDAADQAALDGAVREATRLRVLGSVALATRPVRELPKPAPELHVVPAFLALTSAPMADVEQGENPFDGWKAPVGVALALVGDPQWDLEPELHDHADDERRAARGE